MNQQFIAVLAERVALELRLDAAQARQATAHHDLRVTVSIGISMSPNDGEDAETLIKCADAAMYCAERTGRNAYRFFEPNMNVQVVERQSLAAD